MNHPLDARLACAASFVRPNAVLADVGTDHAYLPIALLAEGRIAYAYAADIAPGPLATARAHLAACAEEDPTLSARIRLVLTDGLAGLEDAAPAVTDISVCGMGGELIARILSDADFVRTPGIRLILQPMTMQPYLRRWLCENGFFVERERLCRTQNGKLYSVICCHYTGVCEAPVHPLIGDAIVSDPDNAQLLPAYLASRMETLRRVTAGRDSAQIACEEEQAALAYAEALAKQLA